MDHTYEEIRDAALDVLSGRVKPTHGPQQYETLRVGVAEVLARRDEPDNPHAGRRPLLSPADNELFLEAFWDLFRQGLITLGYNDANREFPFFRLTQWGRRQLEDTSAFFADAAAFEEAARERLKRADPSTIRYLGEAMKAYRAEAHTAALALIGVAVEHLCERALEALAFERPDGEPDSDHLPPTAGATPPETVRLSPGGPVLRRIAELKEAIDRNPMLVPPPTRDVVATHLIGVMSILGAFRDETGRPRPEPPEREHVYVLLKAAVDYAGTLIDMAQHFEESRITVVTRSRSRAGASA